jgi:hypothetical protein
MPLPRPELGLVVQYGFVWSGADRHPPPDSGKDRPCLIVNLRGVEDAPGRPSLRVTYLPISHVAPRKGEKAIPIGAKLAKHLGLTSEKSYLYVSYACQDDWPFDVARAPGSDSFAYGVIPPALFETIAAEFVKFLRKRPGFVHRRKT